MPSHVVFPVSIRKGLRWSGPCLLLATLALVVGCGNPGGGTNNSVTGKVTLNGQPVSGIVTFVYSGTTPEATAPISPEGTYTMVNPSPGSVKIVIRPMPGAGAVSPTPVKDAPAMPGTIGKQGVSPPAKYGAAATSDLTYEVKAGKHTHDIELKP